MIVNWAANAVTAWALHAQNGEVRNDAEHLSWPQQVHEIGPVKTSTKHSSMRKGRIEIIFTTLNSAQFIVQFTSLKHCSICDCYQLGSRCSNCMSFEVRGPLLALLQIREFRIIWNIFTGSKAEGTRQRLSMIKTRNNFKCYSLKHVVFLYRVCIVNDVFLNYFIIFFNFFLFLLNFFIYCFAKIFIILFYKVFFITSFCKNFYHVVC